jgi:hypothetical protein
MFVPENERSQGIEVTVYMYRRIGGFPVFSASSAGMFPGEKNPKSELLLRLNPLISSQNGSLWGQVGSYGIKKGAKCADIISGGPVRS